LIVHNVVSLKVNPADRDARHLLGQAEFSWLLAEAKQCLDAGNPDRACKLYRKALRVHPTSATPDYNLGVVYLRRGRFEKALQSFRNAARKVPWNAETHYNLAMCHWKMGRQGPCRLELEKALTFDPGMEKAREALGRLRELQGREP